MSDGSEANTGRLTSDETSVSDPTDQTTIEPYLASPTEESSNDQKSPMMHIMKKYRPPSEKYMSDSGMSDCGGSQSNQQDETLVVQEDKAPVPIVPKYKVINSNTYSSTFSILVCAQLPSTSNCTANNYNTNSNLSTAHRGTSFSCAKLCAHRSRLLSTMQPMWSH